MNTSTATLSDSQRTKEKAILGAIVFDTIVTLVFAFAAFLSGSMTAISEVIRMMMLLVIEYAAFSVLKKSHRGLFSEYQYGTGKIERMTNILVAIGLLIVSAFIFQTLFTRTDNTAISSDLLIIAVISATANLMVNYYFAAAFIRANEDETSIIVEAQIEARTAKTIASAVVLAILVMTAMLKDPVASRMIDTAGSMFVAVYMLFIAYGLIRRSLPEILDRTIADPEHFQLIRLLVKHFDAYDGLLDYQARRSGNDLFIIMQLAFFADQTLGEVQQRLAPLREAVEAEMPGSKVTIEQSILPPKHRSKASAATLSRPGH